MGFFLSSRAISRGNKEEEKKGGRKESPEYTEEVKEIDKGLDVREQGVGGTGAE